MNMQSPCSTACGKCGNAIDLADDGWLPLGPEARMQFKVCQACGYRVTAVVGPPEALWALEDASRFIRDEEPIFVDYRHLPHFQRRH